MIHCLRHLTDLHHGRRQLQAAGRPVPLGYLQAEAATLAHLHRYAEAMPLYQQALQQQPHNGRTLFLLAQLAQQTGNPAEACALLHQSEAAGYAPAAEAAASCH